MKLIVDAGLIGLVWVLGIGALTISLCLIIFDIIRPRIPDIFDRRRRALPPDQLGFPVDDGRRQVPTQPSLAPLAWIPYVWKLSDAHVKQTHGMDTLMLLRFYRAMAKLFLTLAFFATAVLIPVYVTGANKKLSKKNRFRVFGIRIVSFANIPRQDTLRMSFVFVADLFMTLFVLHTLFCELKYLIRQRRQYKSSDHPSNYAVVVQNIPPKVANKRDLTQIWESLFPESIETIVAIPRCAKIDRYRREYFEAVRQRQRAQAVLKGFEADLRKKTSHGSSAQAGTASCSSANTNQAQGSFFGSFLPEDNINAPRAAHVSPPDSAYTDVVLDNTPQPGLRKKSSLTERLRLTSALKTLKDPKKYLDHWSKKEKETLAKIDGMRSRDDIFDEKNVTKSALVVFTRKQDALMAAQSNFSASRVHWRVAPAPDPKALSWELFGGSSRLILPRKLLVLALTVTLTIFWVVPTALIQSLANINALSQTPAFSWLSFIENLTPEFSGFVQGLLPALVLEIVMIVIPHVIRLFLRLKRIPSKVQVEREVLQNMIAFLYFSHLIYVVLSGSLLEYSDEIIRNPSNIVRILARSIPQQGTFMMSVVLLTTVVQVPLGVLQPIRIFKRWLGMKRAWTVRERELVNAANSPADHFEAYSFGTIFAVLGIVYSTLTPLLLIICSGFFVLSYTAVKYKLIFTQTQNWEGFGSLHIIALHGVVSGVIFKQVTMAGLMVLQKQATLATLEFIAAGLIAAIVIVQKDSVLAVVEHGALTDLAQISTIRFSEVITCRDLSLGRNEVEDVYKHPSYSPVREFGDEEVV